jgi:hypothetical protein
MNRGEGPVLEKRLYDIIHNSVRAGNLRATSNGAMAVTEARPWSEGQMTFLIINTQQTK